MAHKKAGGSTRNTRDSNPQYLGTKLYSGQTATAGSVIVRQRGTKILAGKNVGLGKDHTLFAMKDGVVEYGEKRKLNYDGTTTTRKIAHVVEKK